MTALLTITANADDVGMWLTVEGELDLLSSRTLEDRLDELHARRTPTVLDLRRLRFIDSTGVRLLIKTCTAARVERWPLKLFAPTGYARRVFEVTGIARALPLIGWPRDSSRAG